MHHRRAAERLTGFFGPNTGSFFVLLLVRLLGYDSLHASTAAELLHTATN